jgi:hypothetical protein
MRVKNIKLFFEEKNISKIIYLLIFPCITFIQISNGQNKFQPIKVNQKSFFDKNSFIESNNKKVVNSHIINSKSQISAVTTDSFELYSCRKFEEIGNDILKIDNWYISKSTLKRVNLGINLKFHDSLIYTGNSLLNPFDKKFSYTNNLNLLNRKNNIEIRRINNIGTSTILEIFNHSIGEVTFLYDVLNDTIKYVGKKEPKAKTNRFLFIDENEKNIKETKNKILQNENSKYFMLGRNLMINRFNLNEIIEIDDLNIILNNENIDNGGLYYYTPYPIIPRCLTFNDSLIIFSVEKSELEKNIKFNSKNKVKNEEISFLNKHIPITEFKNKIVEQLNILKNEESNTINQTIYKNLLTEKRSCAIVYNFKTKTISGILSRAIIPFSLIDNIIIDKTNQLIIINGDDYFTIFDSNNFKEIITIKGDAKSIDHNNNLITEPIIEIKNIGRINESYRITYTKYDLNELINKNKFYQEKIEYKNIDEFTTKKEFLSQLDHHYKNNFSQFIEKNKTPVSKVINSIKNENDNKLISTNILVNRFDKIESELRKKFNNTERNYSTKEMIFIYKTYEQNNNNKLVFTCNDDFDHPFSDINLSKVKSNFNNIIPVTAVIRMRMGIDQIPRIEINNIDPLKAKILKDYKLIFTIKENPTTIELSLLNYLLEKYPQIIEPLFGIDKDGIHEDSETNRNLKRIFEYTLSIIK